MIVDLKYVAMTKKGFKLNLRTRSFSDASSWMSYFSRPYSGEGRGTTLQFVEQIVDRCIDMIDARGLSDPLMTLLVSELALARVGFANLADTYSNDPFTVASLSALVQHVDHYLDNYKQYIRSPPRLYPGSSPIAIPVPAVSSNSSPSERILYGSH